MCTFIRFLLAELATEPKVISSCDAINTVTVRAMQSDCSKSPGTHLTNFQFGLYWLDKGRLSYGRSKARGAPKCSDIIRADIEK